MEPSASLSGPWTDESGGLIGVLVLAVAGFWGNGGGQILIGVIAAAAAAVIVAVARAAMATVGKRQQGAKDNREMSEFFFDTPANPRTGVPFREGWTTTVNKTLASLHKSTQAILAEVKPDGNGGHNLRGQIDKVAERHDES